MSLNQLVSAAATTVAVAAGAVAVGSKVAAADHGRPASEIAASEKLASEGKLPEEVIDASSDDPRIDLFETVGDTYQLGLLQADVSKVIVDAVGVSWHRFGFKSTPGAAKAVMSAAGWRLRLQNAFTLTYDGQVKVFPGHNSRATSILATHIPADDFARRTLLHGELYPRLMEAADRQKASTVALTIFGAGENGHDFTDAFTAAYQRVKDWLSAHDSTTIRRVILVVYTEAELTAARKVLDTTSPKSTVTAGGDSPPADPLADDPTETTTTVDADAADVTISGHESAPPSGAMF